MDESENNRLAELLAELANENLLVLSELDSRMQKILYKIGYPFYQNKEDTEDSIQEIYFVLSRKAKQFQQNISACAWIVMVYRNFVKSEMRKRRREYRYIRGEVQLIKTQTNATIEGDVDARLVLREIMDKLSDYEQSLLVYYMYAEFTIREIAEIVQKPRTTVDNHLRKLKEKIRKMK